MTLALVCMSHTPLLNLVEPPPKVRAAVNESFDTVRAFVDDYRPDLVVNIGPDHYNGFFYELMPPFCIGYEARSVGDYGSEEGPLSVPSEIAKGLAEFVIDREIDTAISLQMEVDHGAVQPLEVIFGSIAKPSVIPIFVNSVSPPFSRMSRIRKFGSAVGEFLNELDANVLLIGSGGLSHDPPVPQIATATPEQRAGLVSGRHPTAEARSARQQRVIDTAHDFARGTATIQDLAPDWDREFLDVCRSGEVAAFDRYEPDEMDRVAGHSSHEIRTWVAAYSALAAAGPYDVTYEFYRPIPEFIAGFGVTTAVTR